MIKDEMMKKMTVILRAPNYCIYDEKKVVVIEYDEKK